MPLHSLPLVASDKWRGLRCGYGDKGGFRLVEGELPYRIAGLGGSRDEKKRSKIVLLKNPSSSFFDQAEGPAGRAHMRELIVHI